MPIQTLVDVFTENRAEVIDALAHQLARNRYIGKFRTVTLSELRAMLDRLLNHYAKWCEGDEREESRCLELLENTCFALSIPLVEAAYALYVVRDGLMAVLSSGEENGKGESIQQVTRFFDLLVRDMLRRY